MYVYTHERQHLRCRSQMMCNAWWTDYKENKCQRPNIMVDDLKAKFTLLNFFLSFLLADLQKTDRLPCVCVCGVSLHCLHCYIAVWIDVCIATYGRYIANVTLLCVVMFHCYIAMCCDVTLLHCYCVTLHCYCYDVTLLHYHDVTSTWLHMIWYDIALLCVWRCVVWWCIHRVNGIIVHHYGILSYSIRLCTCICCMRLSALCVDWVLNLQRSGGKSQLQRLHHVVVGRQLV